MVVGWARTIKAGLHSSIDLAAEVNDAEVNQLLEDRSAAQAVKDYATADRIAKELQSRGICYVAERKVWYTAKPRGPKQPPPRSKRKSSEIGGGAGSAEAPPVSASGAAVPVDDSAMEADFADDVEVEADDTADGPAEKKLKKSKKSTKEKKEKKKSKKSKKEA